MKKVVLAEDAEDSARIITAILTKAGFEVQHFVNGAEAYDKIKSGYQADLLITDVLMPVMNGFELIEKLKQESLLPPTIVLTGKQSEEDVIRGLGFGAIDYITKPFNPSLVLVRIKVALAKAQTT